MTTGVFSAASKITGSVGKGVSIITLDADFVQRRNLAQNQKVNHLGDGLVKGAKALVSSVASGVSGLVLDPIAGARQAGVKGFIKGKQITFRAFIFSFFPDPNR